MHAQVSNQPKIYLQIAGFVFPFYGFLLSLTLTLATFHRALAVSDSVLWLLRPIRLWISAWIPSVLPWGKRCITAHLIQCGFFLSKVSSPLCLVSLQCLQRVVFTFCVKLVLIFSRMVSRIKATPALLEVRTSPKVLIGEFELFIMILSSIKTCFCCLISILYLLFFFFLIFAFF